MNRTIQVAPVRKSIIVQATPQRAFQVFTSGIDRWWPKTHGIGPAPVRQTVIEPFVGGRWYQVCEDGSDVTNGHVLVWEPGRRFVASWEINAHWKPDARAEFASEIEVRFLAEGDNRTRIEVEHGKFERMGPEPGQSMRNAVDGGWPGLLELYAAEVARTDSGQHA